MKIELNQEMIEMVLFALGKMDRFGKENEAKEVYMNIISQLQQYEREEILGQMQLLNK